VCDFALFDVESQIANHARRVWMSLTTPAIALEDMTGRHEKRTLARIEKECGTVTWDERLALLRCNREDRHNGVGRRL